MNMLISGKAFKNKNYELTTTAIAVEKYEEKKHVIDKINARIKQTVHLKSEQTIAKKQNKKQNKHIHHRHRFYYRYRVFIMGGILLTLIECVCVSFDAVLSKRSSDIYIQEYSLVYFLLCSQIIPFYRL